MILDKIHLDVMNPLNGESKYFGISNTDKKMSLSKAGDSFELFIPVKVQMI